MYVLTRLRFNCPLANLHQGFDEFMNLVIDDAVEVRLATKTEEEKRRPLGTMESTEAHENIANDATGQVLLKGDNVSLIQAV